MSCQFKISGTFPLTGSAPGAQIIKAAQETRRTWSLDKYDVTIESGSPRIARFCFEVRSSTVFAEEIVKTVQAWANRFGDWAKGVLRYTVAIDGSVRYCFFGPEKRCVEARLCSVATRAEDLQEEWTNLNYTQLPQAGDGCVELTDYTEGAC